MYIFTGRNEVVAKVIFLHLFVILFTGGGCLPQCMLGYPPREQTPRSRHPPEQTLPGADTPQSRHPPGKQTLAYDQWAAGMHPTGMHSCNNEHVKYHQDVIVLNRYVLTTAHKRSLWRLFFHRCVSVCGGGASFHNAPSMYAPCHVCPPAKHAPLPHTPTTHGHPCHACPPAVHTPPPHHAHPPLPRNFDLFYVS